MKLVIFDFDGTLADSFPYIFAFLRKEAGKSAEFTPEEAAEYRDMSMKDMALSIGIPFWKLPFLFFKGRCYMRSHLMEVKPFEGMQEAIQSLYAGGATICIISANSKSNIQRFLKHYSLDGYVSSVWGNAAYLGKTRPIKQLCRRYGVQPKDVWYVGDEVTDIISAKAAGAKMLAVLWGFASNDDIAQSKPTAVANTPAEVVDQVQ